MKIPEKLKVGGKTYKVNVSDHISLGTQYYTGETIYREQVINILDTGNREGMLETLLHETVHAVYDFLGYSDHDEKKVSELSNALYMVISDNAEMFTKD